MAGTMNESPKYLIVNADDLGFAADINAAIEELHQAGRITNATLMVDGACVHEALGVIRRNPGLGIGLHLDLCPALGLYSLPYQTMREAARTPEMQARVAAEVDRQIVSFRSLGLDFTHMDGHRHFHALPEVFSTVIDVAAAHGLKTIRLSKDWIMPRTPSVFWDERFFLDAIGLLERYGIRYSENFVFGWRPYTEVDFRPGWNELMVHVGRAAEEYLREYALIASPEFERRIQASGVQLKSYRDLGGEPKKAQGL
jgi:predicted glycoside hydrolase/deacetylase ChbG (UPF0249 family)